MKNFFDIDEYSENNSFDNYSDSRKILDEADERKFRQENRRNFRLELILSCMGILIAFATLIVTLFK